MIKQLYIHHKLGIMVLSLKMCLLNLVSPFYSLKLWQAYLTSEYVYFNRSYSCVGVVYICTEYLIYVLYYIRDKKNNRRCYCIVWVLCWPCLAEMILLMYSMHHSINNHVVFPETNMHHSPFLFYINLRWGLLKMSGKVTQGGSISHFVFVSN